MRPVNKKIKIRQIRPPLILKVSSNERPSDPNKEQKFSLKPQIAPINKIYTGSNKPMTSINSNRNTSRKNSPMNQVVVNGV